VTSTPAHGFASAQWLVSQERQVTGGGAGSGAAQFEQNRGTVITPSWPGGIVSRTRERITPM
jgi:hypothetical protein